MTEILLTIVGILSGIILGAGVCLYPWKSSALEDRVRALESAEIHRKNRRKHRS